VCIGRDTFGVAGVFEADFSVFLGLKKFFIKKIGSKNLFILNKKSVSSVGNFAFQNLQP